MLIAFTYQEYEDESTHCRRRTTVKTHKLTRLFETTQPTFYTFLFAAVCPAFYSRSFAVCSGRYAWALPRSAPLPLPALCSPSRPPPRLTKAPSEPKRVANTQWNPSPYTLSLSPADTCKQPPLHIPPHRRVDSRVQRRSSGAVLQ